MLVGVVIGLFIDNIIHGYDINKINQTLKTVPHYQLITNGLTGVVQFDLSPTEFPIKY